MRRGVSWTSPVKFRSYLLGLRRPPPGDGPAPWVPRPCPPLLPLPVQCAATRTISQGPLGLAHLLQRQCLMLDPSSARTVSGRGLLGAGNPETTCQDKD